MGQQADSLLLLLVLLSCAIAVLIGWQFSTAVLPAVLGALFSVCAVLLYLGARGSSWSRFGLPLLLCASIALHIQVSLGRLEFHFGVFTTLTVVMVYRDWRVVLASAAFFAVHHVLFDRLQAWGLGIYCTSQPDFVLILLHAAYVVLQTSAEIFIVRRMQQAFLQGHELNTLVQHVDQSHAMVLDVGGQTFKSEVAQRLQQMFLRVHEIIVSVKHAAAQIHAISSKMATSSSNLSARTEQTGASLEKTLAATQEMRQTVEQSAQTADQASRLAGLAADAAWQGKGMVQQLVQNMDIIAQRSARISDIVGVVNGLAFQTNLLALNAAVEAARAGELGHGFAVVADEVRHLALRSAEAARDIRQLIDGSAQAITQGVDFSTQVQSSMQNIGAHIAQAAGHMAEIAQASGQQQQGVAQINASIALLEQASGENAHLAQQSHEEARSLQTQAAFMRRYAEYFVT